MSAVPIVPIPGELTGPYWAAAREHRLVLQRCTACDRRWHPPLPRCPHCHSTALDEAGVAGTGVLYSFTIAHHATHAALADRVPYVVGLVELTEGPRVVANIRGVPPADVRVGTQVRLTFEDVGADVTLPQFEVVPQPRTQQEASRADPGRGAVGGQDRVEDRDDRAGPAQGE